MENVTENLEVNTTQNERQPMKVLYGASEWMKENGFWLEGMGESIDGMEGKVINDYEHLTGNYSHLELDFGFGFTVGVHPQWLELA